MGTGEAKTLTIRLEAGASPIAGVVVAGGRETAFVGWIELAGLIESLRSAQPAGMDGPLARS